MYDNVSMTQVHRYLCLVVFPKADQGWQHWLVSWIRDTLYIIVYEQNYVGIMDCIDNFYRGKGNAIDGYLEKYCSEQCPLRTLFGNMAAFRRRNLACRRCQSIVSTRRNFAKAATLFQQLDVVYFQEDAQSCTATALIGVLSEKNPQSSPARAQRFDHKAISHFAVNKHDGLTFLDCKCQRRRMAPWHLGTCGDNQSMFETYQNPPLRQVAN